MGNFKKRRPKFLNNGALTSGSSNNNDTKEGFTDSEKNRKVQSPEQGSIDRNPQPNLEKNKEELSLKESSEFDKFRKIIEKFTNSCFDKIKECLNESSNGRVKISDLVNCLKEKKCFNFYNETMRIEELIKALCINSVEGSFSCFSKPITEISCSLEGENVIFQNENKKNEDCYCETNYLFRVDRDYIEIYNPKKHGWWKTETEGSKCFARMFKPPSFNKNIGEFTLNISTIQGIQDSYWKDLTLHCYFNWLESLYENECQDFVSNLRNIVQEKREQLIEAAREENISTFKDVFDSILKELNSLSKSNTISWGGCLLTRSRINQQLTQDCWNSIFNLVQLAYGITSTNFERKIRELFQHVNEIAEKCQGCRNTFTSWLLFLSNPEFFMPLCQDNMPYAINSLADLIMSRLKGAEGIRDYRSNTQKCIGGHSDNIGCFLELFVILNDFRLKKDYQDMIPLICYFFKRKKAERDIMTEKNITTSGTLITAKASLNLILYGPPGTGKTYKAKQKAVEIVEGRESTKLEKAFYKYLKDGKICFVTFHPSFAYENFVEGIRAKVLNGQVNYYVEDGIFKRICINAMWHALKEKSNNVAYDRKKNEVMEGLNRALEEDVDKVFDFDNAEKFVLIIDEINRGNIPSIFGELITLIEENKRLGANEPLFVTLPYSGEQFAVPKNLYIIGTMNTTDRSIILLDTALRRRFTFEELMPKLDLVDFKVGSVDVKNLLKTINERIKGEIGRDYQIGHSYFLPLKNNSDIQFLGFIFRNQVLPLLQEYFHGRWERIIQERILGRRSEDFINEKGDIVLDINRPDLEKLFVSVYVQEAQSNDNQDSD